MIIDAMKCTQFKTVESTAIMIRIKHHSYNDQDKASQL